MTLKEGEEKEASAGVLPRSGTPPTGIWEM